VGGPFAVVGCTSWSKYDVSVDLMSEDNDWIGLVFGWQDRDNFFVGDLDSSGGG